MFYFCFKQPGPPVSAVHNNKKTADHLLCYQRLYSSSKQAAQAVAPELLDYIHWKL